jgi:uncharacterized protein (UPF0332 family)
MGFREKSEENQRVAKKCSTTRAFNAGASRAYYSAFLLARHVLDKKQFDYPAFLTSRRLVDQKPYSHGTIERALVECLMRDGKNRLDIYRLSVLDSLYRRRIAADYRAESLSEVDLMDSLRELDDVIRVLS